MVLATDQKTSYRLGPWALSDLLPSPDEALVAGRLAALETAVADFEKQRDVLRPDMDPEDFLNIVRRYEALVEQLSELSSYAWLWFYEDTGNPDALTFRNRVRQVTTHASNRVLFCGIWWKELGDAEAAALLPKDPADADLRHFLEDVRRFRSFTLDERSEQIINLKDDNGIAALTTLYSMLTNRLEFTLEVDGEVKRLTRDALLSHTFSPRSDLRAAAYQELNRVYQAEATILGQIYINRVRDWHH